MTARSRSSGTATPTTRTRTRTRTRTSVLSRTRTSVLSQTLTQVIRTRATPTTRATPAARRRRPADVAGQLRVYRRRIRSVQSTKKITRAMELVAASRISKAQGRVTASKPYAEEITRVITAVASSTNVEHPLTTEREDPKRAAVLVITSDRGLAGAYSSSALRRGEELFATLSQEGKQ